MKKTLLLAGVASIFAFNADATEYNWMKDWSPYIGADYVYSHGKFGGEAEAFYQQSGERKSHEAAGDYKTEFLSYGLDMYGYMPIMCSDFNLLGSLGLANYRVRFKYPTEKAFHKNRIGYRAGIGMQWDFTEHMAVRVMGRYSYLGMSELDNLKEVTVGLRYTF